MRNFVVAAFLPALPFVAGAQPGWDRVERLRPDQAVTVHLRDGGTLKGKLEAAGAGGLSLVTGRGTAVQVAKAEVARVTRRSRAKGAMWGGIIGFGIAAPVGAYAGPYLADWGNPPPGVRLRHGAGWGLFFGGVGAGIGALAGTRTTVYLATAPH